jgi:hypothetical protein
MTTREVSKGRNRAAPASRAIGRPTLYSEALADQICARLAEGASLRSICKAKGMPACSTVFGWLRSDKAFLEQYARAREAQADALFDEILEIADDGRRDYRQTKSGREFDHEHVQRARLRIDTRKWIASKLLPKKYGDKVDLSHSGPDGAPLVPAAVAPVIVLGAEAAAAIAKKLLEEV